MSAVLISRLLACLVFVVIGLQSMGTVVGQQTQAPFSLQASVEEYRIPNTEVFDLKSKSGRDYRIFIAKPEGDPPPSGYSVLYVLDANGYFSLAASLNRLRSHYPKTRALVVGIGYPIDGSFDMKRRTFDLTTKASPEKLPPSRGGTGWPESGGADQFLNFILDELKPLLAEKYSVDSSRQAIVGHSFGGLFVMHTLFTKPDAFQSYVAISPSGWWNDYALLDEEKTFAKTAGDLNTSVEVLIEVGELELASNSGPAAALDPTSASNEFGTTREFAKRLMKFDSNKLIVKYREFEDKDHGSVVPPAMIEAFQFVFPASPSSRRTVPPGSRENQ